MFQGSRMLQGSGDRLHATSLPTYQYIFYSHPELSFHRCEPYHPRKPALVFPKHIMASLGEDLLVTVNKLQDLVFNTIGNDSLDLPQIVSLLKRLSIWSGSSRLISCNPRLIPTFLGRRWFPIIRKVVGPREYSRKRLPSKRKWNCYATSSDPATYQRTK